MVDVNIQTTIGPYTQQPVCTRPLLSTKQLDAVVAAAVKAQKGWRKTPLDERIAIVEAWMTEFEKNGDVLAEDIAVQMGRPIGQCMGEINGTLYRARHLVKIAKEALAPIPQTETDDEANKRYIIKQPLGVVVAITPWNFPHLTAVNSIIPALLAGNAVIVKPAPQTPVPAERVLECFNAAGLPTNVLQVIHLLQGATLEVCADPRVNFVSFTGSVPGGRAVQEAAAHGKGFKGVGLELGGKDPAYVRADADLAYTVPNLVDGAFFNSGQSCCSVERIYVHSAIYEDFVSQFADLTKKDYKLGDPMEEGTTLGPVVSLASAKRIREQVAAAVKAGAKLVVGEDEFEGAKEGTTLVGPQVITNVDHTMGIMTEETFGPVAAIMKVESDEEALALMNDSKYGLTASVWTNPDDAASIAVFNNFVEDLEAGTVYLNRADALDPAVPWTGVKDTGRGYSLSVLGYGQLTQAKSVMMRVKL